MIFTGGIGKGMLGRVTPKLDAVSTDLTKLVKKQKIRNIIDREKEIQTMAELLASEKQDVLIIGEPGSGKTSIVEGIAFRVIAGTEFKTLKNKRIVNLDIGSLISGTKTTGDVAKKIKDVVEEVEGSGDIILFIDEIHNLVHSGGDSEIDTSVVFSTLEPHIAAANIQIIGATNVENYRKYIEPNGAFSRLFQTVEIKELDKENTIKILKKKARQLQKQA